MLPYITSFNTLNCQKHVTLSLSRYLHLSVWNHKYNHFPNVGSLFCQPFQNVTVPLHFRRMNKWKAINMSLSLQSGTLHCTSMQRTACLPGSGSDVRFVRQQRYVTMSAWKKKCHSENSDFVPAVFKYQCSTRRRPDSTQYISWSSICFKLWAKCLHSSELITFFVSTAELIFSQENS